MPDRIPRAAHAGQSGPTVGDRVRLADTDLVVAVERDFTAGGGAPHHGEGGMVHDEVGRGPATHAEGAADTVIADALIIDHWGIVKADVGIRDGRISGIGKAGDPDVQAGIDILVGPGTEVIAGGGKILTAGALDAHVPFVAPRDIEAALAAGVTTMLGGGTVPAAGAVASAFTPGPWHLGRMIRASEAFPMNLAFAGNGDASLPAALEEEVRGGAAALMLHEAWRATPGAIDCCLAVADAFDVQVMIRGDTSAAPGFPDAAVAALRGRTVHAVDVAGGSARLAGLDTVLPSSGAGDAAAAGDILHDIGALAMIASGAAGRTGGVLIRAWQAAHRMKAARGPLPEDEGRGSDNFRVKRYLAKYTINPAIAHGIDEWVGSVTIGKLADLVLWSPPLFGVKPDLVIKTGTIAMAAATGRYQPMLAAFGGAAAHAGVTFVSQAAAADGLAETLGVERALLPARHTRGLVKQSMIHNGATPRIEVDPGTGAIRADGALLAAPPAGTLPMAQRYFLF